MQITNGRSWIMHLRLCSASASASKDDGYSKTCTPCYVSEGHIEHGLNIKVFLNTLCAEHSCEATSICASVHPCEALFHAKFEVFCMK